MPDESVRVDRWLWATRTFKTRSQATAACAAGHVRVNGEVVKASRKLRAGEVVDARAPRGRRVLEVRAMAVKRLSATAAAELFIDQTPAPPPASVAPRVARRERGSGRPTKRDRRQIEQLRED